VHARVTNAGPQGRRLIQHRMLYGDNGDLGDAEYGQDRRLDLRCGDIFAADFEHVLGAIREIKAAILA